MEDGLTKYIQQQRGSTAEICVLSRVPIDQPTLPISQNTVGIHRSEKIVIGKHVSLLEAENFFQSFSHRLSIPFGPPPPVSELGVFWSL